MVEITAISNGITNFAGQHMMPKMDSKGQFVLGIALGVLSGRMENVIASLAENELIQTLGIFQDGQLDWDAIYTAALAQMGRQKNLVWDVPMLGTLTFNEQDLRDLHKCITGGVH